VDDFEGRFSTGSLLSYTGRQLQVGGRHGSGMQAPSTRPEDDEASEGDDVDSASGEHHGDQRQVREQHDRPGERGTGEARNDDRGQEAGGAGHASNIDRPREFNAAVASFVGAL